MSASHAIAQLRHLYKQMIAGEVRDTAQAARGLLGPAIVKLEHAGAKEELKDHALRRMLWRSVADSASCTCEADDQCPECNVMVALFGVPWTSVDDARKRLLAGVRP